MQIIFLHHSSFLVEVDDKVLIFDYFDGNKLNVKDLTANVALLAPTGRASKRMSESTGLPATTIHRFLKWNKETDEFMINEYNPDFSNLIIVDEVSMIDTILLVWIFSLIA